MFKGIFSYAGITSEVEGYDLRTYFLIMVKNDPNRKLSSGAFDTDSESLIPPPSDIPVMLKSGGIVFQNYVPPNTNATPKYFVDWYKKLHEILWGLKTCKRGSTADSLDSLFDDGSSFDESKWLESQFGGSVYIRTGALEGAKYSDDEGTELLVEPTEYNTSLAPLGNKTLTVSVKAPVLQDEVSQGTEVLSSDFYTFEQICETNPDKNFDWLKDSSYVIATPDTYQDICRQIMKHPGVVAFDTETTGLNINFKSLTGEGDQLVGMVFSIQEGQSWYFPIAHESGIDNICSKEDVPSVIEKFFKPILEKKNIVTFNGYFDAKVMLIYGIVCNIFADVLTMYRLTYANITGGVQVGNRLVMNLKALTKEYLHRDSLELNMFVPGKWGENAMTFQYMPYESVRLYACADTDNTLALYNLFMGKRALEEFGATQTFKIENAFAPVLAYSEFYGIHVDSENIDRLEVEIAQEEETLKQQMVEIAGRDFNPRSSRDLASILYEELGYPCKVMTEKGAKSTSKEAIKDLKSYKNPDGSSKYPFADLLQQFRDISNIRSGLIKSFRENGTPDGYMFTKIEPMLATGRMSTSNPNIQGMSGTVKKYFTPREGYYMMNFDFSSIEYRILACVGGEPDLIEFFKDPIRDYHRRQASVLFGVPYEEVTPDLRKIAKPFNFALPYGKGDRNLGKDLFGEVSEENTRKAADLRKKYFAGQPHIEKFFDQAKKEARENNYVATFFGRRRYFDPVKLGNGNIQAGYAAMMRQAGNHKIQGCAADLYKSGMTNLFQAMRHEDWLGKVLLTAFVHDECNIEVHNSIAPWEILEVALGSIMIEIDNWCPLYVGVGFGTNWKQAKSMDLPVKVQRQLVDEEHEPWDGNINKYVDYIEAKRLQYLIDFVTDYVTDSNNWGKIIDPDVKSMAFEALERSGESEESLDKFYEVFKLDPELKEKILTELPDKPATVEVKKVQEEPSSYVSMWDRLEAVGVLVQDSGMIWLLYDEDVFDKITEVINNYQGTQLATLQVGVYYPNTKETRTLDKEYIPPALVGDIVNIYLQSGVLK